MASVADETFSARTIFKTAPGKSIGAKGATLPV
jgi:hypothetical protein